MEKSITAASASSGGTEVGVEVTYEPSRLGDTRGTLTVFSAVGGEYVFPLLVTVAPLSLKDLTPSIWRYYIDPIQECIFTHNTVHLLCGQSLF